MECMCYYNIINYVCQLKQKQNALTKIVIVKNKTQTISNTSDLCAGNYTFIVYFL